MRAIYNRELKAYFTSMIAPLFIAALVLITGIYFMAYNLRAGWPYFTYTIESIIFIFTLTIPILTMRSMSEERRQKTDQLLLTSPVTVTQMVLGKYFAMVTVVAIPCLIFCLCPLIISTGGTFYPAVDYTCILLFFLTGCVYVAIGMLISSMTESVIIAAVGTIGALILLNLLPGLAGMYPTASVWSFAGCCVILTLIAVLFYVMSKNLFAAGAIEIVGLVVLAALYFINPGMYENCIANLFEMLAVPDVFYNLSANYLFDLAGIVKLLSAAGICLFLTVQSVQKRRWS